MSRLYRGLLLTLCLFAFWPAPAEGKPKPALSVLGSSTVVTVGPGQGEDTATGYFSLLNPGARPVQIAVSFQAASSDSVAIETVTPTRLKPGKAERVGVTFSGLKDLDAAVSGQLVVSGGATPIAQAVAVNPPPPDTPWSAIVIAGSFVLAVIIGLAVVGAMPNNDRSSLRNPAPGPKWTFSSWATTLTAFAVVFATVLATTTLPPFPDQIDKPTLVNLNILFGILAVLGPFLSQALRRGTLTEDQQREGQTGTNFTLLVACTVTLWAVLGQLSVFGLLVWELVGGGAVAGAIGALLILIALLAIRYFFLTTSELVIRTWTLPAAEIPVAPAPARQRLLDLRGIDQLALRATMPMMSFTQDPEERTAELTVQPPALRAPSHWSLL